VIVVDDQNRENEGDLTMAADLVTPRPSTSWPLTSRPHLPGNLRRKSGQLAPPHDDPGQPLAAQHRFHGQRRRTPGISTGISARERAHTIRTAVAPDAAPDDLVTPGHVFPLRAKRGGVLVRTGHTEASVDLARMAGRTPAGVICEIMRPDGEMARMPDLESFAPSMAGHRAHLDLVQYRLAREVLVHRVAETTLRPSGAGCARATGPACTRLTWPTPSIWPWCW